MRLIRPILGMLTVCTLLIVVRKPFVFLSVLLVVSIYRCLLILCLKVLARQSSTHQLYSAFHLWRFHDCVRHSWLLFLGVKILHLLKMLQLLILSVIWVHTYLPLKHSLSILRLLSQLLNTVHLFRSWSHLRSLEKHRSWISCNGSYRRGVGSWSYSRDIWAHCWINIEVRKLIISAGVWIVLLSYATAVYDMLISHLWGEWVILNIFYAGTFCLFLMVFLQKFLF